MQIQLRHDSQTVSPVNAHEAYSWETKHTGFLQKPHGVVCPKLSALLSAAPEFVGSGIGSFAPRGESLSAGSRAISLPATE